MIAKDFVTVNGTIIARVRFTWPADAGIERLCLTGDFNDWNDTSHPFQRDAQGQWTITLDLDLRRVYRFGYLGNGCETLHESQADAYPLIRDRVRSFVVVTDPAFRPYRFDHLAERSRRPAVNQDSQADRAA